MIDVSLEQAKGDRDRVEAVGRAVALGARKMGADLTTMRLSEGECSG
ncbi:hypothetical protein SPHI_18540 [Sphingomonas jeddahensis]|uniref:Uncharacterized protein n=2 Tax=Sphingomonas jeddahensis TaxID=1915074 RepID=A0A1V2ETW0_9SPHN|nr:hypothetical protein SPHI_18540 [Sphingomonas jeddahensis]